MEPILFMLLGGVISLLIARLASRFIGFPAQRVEDYEDAPQTLDLRRHLNGAISCDGVIYGPTGRIASRFRGDFRADWTGDQAVMEEKLFHDTGTVQNRRWQLSLGENGDLTATANDIIGTARGRQAGSAARLTYRIRLPDSAGGHVLDVVDWMYLAPGGAIVNRSQFRKFGFKVAELVAVMRPEEAGRMAV